MHYTVTSPENSSGFGGIYYNVPTEQEIGRIYEIIASKCENFVEEKYAEDLEMYPKAKERLAKELDLMNQTKCAFEFFLVDAVLQYSLRKGYPILAHSTMAGSFIAYLLGISNFNPIASETWIDIEMVWKLRYGKITPPGFEIGIASSAREGLAHYLNSTSEFYNVKVNREIYKFLSMPDNNMCWKIGELIRKTNVYYDYSMSEELSNDALQSWIDEEIKFLCQCVLEGGGAEKEKAYIEDIVLLQSIRSVENVNKVLFTKLYAYSRMGYKEKITFEKLSQTDFYVFEDDLFSALLDLNISKEKVAELVFDKRVRASLCNDMTYVNQLAEYNVPNKLVDYYSTVYNLWDKASCISRVNMFYTLEWYKQNYPVEYEEVTIER